MDPFKLKHKFKASPTVRDGIWFPSKLEASYYDHLMLMQAAGLVLFFNRQVKFDLGGNTSYAVDFVVYYADGDIRFIDVKGKVTPEFTKAKKQVEARYPVTIEVVKRGDF